jgi:uracil-DNA glycosylase family 4
MTPLQQHFQKYATGCGACQCRTATRIVFCRGSVPADVLFVGEAPGISEDVVGQPFVGPAGKLLDGWIAATLVDHQRYAITNLVGCLPTNDDGEKGAPDEEQIKACRSRLLDFIMLCKPRLIACVGQLAAKGVRDRFIQERLFAAGFGNTKVVDIVHPAFVLRQNIAQQAMLGQRAVVTLANAVRNVDVPF